MKQAVAFVSQLEIEQQRQWLMLLKAVLPNELIVLANEMSIQQRRECQVAIVANPSKQQLTDFTGLKWVQSLWAGVDNLIHPAKEFGFSLTRLIDPQLAETMAEAVLAWTLYLHRKMPTYQQQQREKQWIQQSYAPADGCHVSLLGLGELGQKCAHRLIANGFNVSGWSQNKKSLKNVLCYSGQAGLGKMLKTCDIVVCLLPLTSLTKGLLNQAFFEQLNKHASVINFARGELLEIDALLKMLDKNALYHAVLDVFKQEPLDKNSPLWHHPKITVLPHIAATTNPQTAASIVASHFKRYRENGIAPNPVDINKGY